MKKLFTLFVIISGTLCILAQSPQKMSYQCVVRNSGGDLVTNQAVGIKLSIMQSSANGTVVYTETQTPTTNENGLVSIEIGGGTGFNAIDWSNGLYFLKTETDPTGGTNYTIAGTTQLLSVPYAFYSNTSADAVKITGDQTVGGTKTFTNTIVANNGINANNNVISNVAEPTNSQHAATKAYVDALKETIFDELLDAGMNGIAKDADGNTYKTIKIGLQLWMVQNLKTTKFNDGTPIPLVTDLTAWNNLTTPGYCWYNNDQITYGSTYGALYNWYAIDPVSNGGKNVCPTGWFVPTNTEWTTLVNYLIANGYNYDGTTSGNKVAKSLATTSGWVPSFLNGVVGSTDYPEKRNATGFTGLPGGIRYEGGFVYAVQTGSWWSVTEQSNTTAWRYWLDNTSVALNGNIVHKYIGSSVRCVKINLPVGETEAATAVTSTSVTLNGNVNAYGPSATVTFEYGTTTSYGSVITAMPSPVSGTSPVDISASLNSLAPATTYHYRVKTENSNGTSYANDMTFTTPVQVTDADGNVYNSVLVGTQVWMAGNLKTTRLNDGTTIPLVSDNTSWSNLITPGYCWYNNDAATYKAEYGALYNWYTVNTGKVCPAGWHAPTDAEWTALTDAFGGESEAGGKLKESETTHWLSPNTGATNESGFTGLPGGFRERYGTFYDIGYDGTWWSSTEQSADNGWFRTLTNSTGSVIRGNFFHKKTGFSIRCVKN